VVNRLQKVLEDTNIKLGDVATDITGQSARAMLKALLAGQTDPVKLANLAKGKMRAKLAALEEALVGVIKPHQQFLLTELLGQLDSLDAAITRVGNEIATWMERDRPAEPEPTSGQDEPKKLLTWAQAVVLLCTIPGISQRAAQGILAEIGRDMTRFPAAAHLASSAGYPTAQAITKVPANDCRARRAKAAPIYVNCSLRRPTQRHGPRTPTFPRTTIVSPLVEAESEHSSLWDTPFW